MPEELRGAGMKITMIMFMKHKPWALKKIYDLPSVPRKGEMVEVCHDGWEEVECVTWNEDGSIEINLTSSIDTEDLANGCIEDGWVMS